MPVKRFTAQHWRDRAEEARAHAEQMHNPSTRQLLLDIANNYDQLAEQAQRLSRQRDAAQDG